MQGLWKCRAYLLTNSMTISMVAMIVGPPESSDDDDGGRGNEDDDARDDDEIDWADDPFYHKVKPYLEDLLLEGNTL